MTSCRGIANALTLKILPWLASIRVLWKKILPVQVEYIVFTLNTCARRATARWLRCAALRVSAVRCAPEHADRTCGPLRTAFGADPVQACWSRPEQWCGPSPQTDRIRCGPTQSRAGSKPCFLHLKPSARNAFYTIGHWLNRSFYQVTSHFYTVVTGITA